MKIEQQIYTRERKGIFRQSEGYDTIAVSPGLTPEFVKKNLHPYCVYPNGVTAANAPPAITIAHFPCGRMLLGQAVYVPKDFTGQRSTFFVHNYILPPNIVSNVLADIENILCFVEFLTRYDIEQGYKLNTLDSLPMKAGNKKIYFIDELAGVYRRLPEPEKHKLGVCTYARETTNTKGLHLIFTENKTVWKNKPKSICPGSGDSPYAELHSLISPLSYAEFFVEIAFWKSRLTSLVHFENLHQIELGWLNKNLDTLTPTELLKIPQDFITQGKRTNNPEIYTILGILKTIAAARKPLDLRYLIGSYLLPLAAKERIMQNIRRICYTNA